LPQSLPGRFWTKVERIPFHECWEWNASFFPDGYGYYWHQGRGVGAHRVSYASLVGPIPEGLGVLHRCDNPPCVNPAHLFVGDQKANNADMCAKGRVSSPLSLEQVRDIKRLISEGVPQKEIAALYQIAAPTVSHIGSGYRWSAA
jgi:hypothetical protein